MPTFQYPTFCLEIAGVSVERTLVLHPSVYPAALNQLQLSCKLFSLLAASPSLPRRTPTGI